MQRQQTVRFPSGGLPHASLDLAAGLAWVVMLFCTQSVIRDCWLQPRRGSLLLYGAYDCEAGEVVVVMAFVCACISLLMWLDAKVKLRPAGRHERFVFQMWWPALVLGMSLAFVAGPMRRGAKAHSLAVFREATRAYTSQLRGFADVPAQADLDSLRRRVAHALPGVSRGMFRVERAPVRLRYAEGLSFEFDADGRVRRVRRGAIIDRDATERHHDRREVDIIAQMGPPEHRDVYFRAPWQLVYGEVYGWPPGRLVYRLDQPAWRLDGRGGLLSDDPYAWLSWHAE